jgi:hypothetical protein
VQFQDTIVLEDDIVGQLSPKTAMECKLAQVPPDIWNSLSLEEKKCLLNEHKRQQQEDDKLKSSNSANMNNSRTSGRETNNLKSNSIMPKQYAKVKNAVVGEDENQDQPMNTYDFVEEFLEDTIKSSNYMENKMLTMTFCIISV